MTQDTETHTDDKIAFKKQENHTSTLSFLAAFIVILVIVSILAYRSGVDVKQLKADMANFKTALTQRYAKDGQHVAFDYGDVKAEGGILSQTVIIENPTLVVGKDSHAYKIHSAQAVVTPEDSSFNSFSAKLTSPVTLTQLATNTEYRYVTKLPVVVDLSVNEQGEREYHLPLQEVSRLEVAHDQDVKLYDITVKNDSFMTGTFSDTDTSMYGFNATLHDGLITHDALNTRFKHATYDMDKQGTRHEQEFNIEDVTSDLIPQSLTPVSIDLSQTLDEVKESQSMLLTIEQLVATHNNYSLNVEGNVALVKDQLLPYADVNISVDGADYIINAMNKSDLVSDTVTRIVQKALHNVAPAWNPGTQAPLAFEINRAGDAPFMIGKVKADELFALVIKEYYMGAQTAPAAPTGADASDATSVPLNNVAPSAPQPVTPDSDTPPAATENISGEQNSATDDVDLNKKIDDTLAQAKKDATETKEKFNQLQNEPAPVSAPEQGADAVTKPAVPSDTVELEAPKAD